MDIQRIIGELLERARIDEALLRLEKLFLTQMPRRGRPPGGRREATLTAAPDGNGPNDSANGARRMVAGA